MPMQTADLNFYFGKGLDENDEIIQLALQKNIIQQVGSWFKYKDKNIGRNILTLMDLLTKNQEFKLELLKELKLNE